jgi:hypothetical protein
MSRNFVQVALPRAGLGHSLQSYSRAFVYYASGAAEFVHPNWFRLRIGPYLRRELDKRNYHLIIQTPGGWGLPPWHAARRLFSRVVDESSFDPAGSGQYLVVRDDRKHDFRILEPYRDRFVDALHSISRMKADRSPIGTPTIGIFHRSGDMRGRKPDSSEERVLRTHGYGYIPVGYAAEALARLRRIAGWQVPAVLSTDAMPDEVAPIMSQGRVQLARTDSALVNMLEMSRHAVLVIGTSSYGRWSWFLGNAFAIVPRVENPKAWIPPIENRDSAWFVFDDDTSLNDAAVSALVSARLARPR